MKRSITLFSFAILPLYLLSFAIVSVNQEKHNDWIPITSYQQVGQTFVAKNNNLYRIELFSVNPQAWDGKKIIFHLKDRVNSQSDIATFTLASSNIANQSLLRIQFSPIPNSKGHTYYFNFEMTKGLDENAAQLAYFKSDVLPNGSMYVNQKPHSGDLYLMTSYKGNFWDLLKSFVSRFTEDKLFAPLYIVLLVGSVLLIIYSYRNFKRN